MSEMKKYTNQTFTKRVDHEAGSHRAEQGLAEPAVCQYCGNVYADRRWTRPGEAVEGEKHPHFRPPQQVVCPACRAERSGIASGYVHLDGGFLGLHLTEIENLLRNEAERAGEDNPLARIMGIDNADASAASGQCEMTVRTTTEHLAQRLGHALEKAFHGEVRYDFSHENKLAHVWWRRDV
jgi:hypothetical protein